MIKKWTALVLSVGFLGASLQGWADDDFDNLAKLVVKGQASVFKPADQMEVTLGVLTTAENSTLALNENNQRMHQIVANLQALGLDDSDFQTGRFRIQPIYRQPQSKSSEPSQTISHYEVVNNIYIKTQKMALADRLISAAVEGGANQVENVNFNLGNPQAYREEAIQLAVQHALADARALAHAANVRLARILYVSLDQWQNRPQMPGYFYAKMSTGDNAGQTPLEAGQVEVHAAVDLTFEIVSNLRETKDF